MALTETTFEKRLAILLRLLGRPALPGLFNPYSDVDETLDLKSAPRRRRSNLREYLRAHRQARRVLVGEAAGYNGCRFSGMPFAGEDLLVGDRPLPWTEGRSLQRSSRGATLRSERSANIVWSSLANDRRLVLWNAVPWHPPRPGEALSNRKPKRKEEEAGLVLLDAFLDIYPQAVPVAVGRVAESAIEKVGRRAVYLRHPSMGGQKKFLAGLADEKRRLDAEEISSL